MDLRGAGPGVLDLCTQYLEMFLEPATFWIQSVTSHPDTVNVSLTGELSHGASIDF